MQRPLTRLQQWPPSISSPQLKDLHKVHVPQVFHCDPKHSNGNSPRFTRQVLILHAMLRLGEGQLAHQGQMQRLSVTILQQCPPSRHSPHSKHSLQLMPSERLVLTLRWTGALKRFTCFVMIAGTDLNGSASTSPSRTDANAVPYKAAPEATIKA